MLQYCGWNSVLLLSSFFKTFKFIRGEEGGQAVLQSHHGPPKPGGDAGDDKPVERDEAESLTAALGPL